MYLSISLYKNNYFSNIKLTFLILQDQTSTKYPAHGTQLCIPFLEPAASKEKMYVLMIHISKCNEKIIDKHNKHVVNSVVVAC